jgi:hypothetical protein
MFIPWRPTKEEIERWLKTKELEFVQQDNRNPGVTPHKYLEKYVFTDLHEVFFCDFPHLLQEWILRLKYNHATNQIRQLEWNPVQIVQLQQVNNKFTRVVDFWLDSIVAGFITEFAVDTTKSYNAAEKEFLRGPRGRYIRSLYTSIKILLYNNGVMTMASDN